MTDTNNEAAATIERGVVIETGTETEIGTEIGERVVTTDTSLDEMSTTRRTVIDPTDEMTERAATVGTETGIVQISAAHAINVRIVATDITKVNNGEVRRKIADHPESAAPTPQTCLALGELERVAIATAKNMRRLCERTMTPTNVRDRTNTVMTF